MGMTITRRLGERFEVDGPAVVELAYIGRNRVRYVVHADRSTNITILNENNGTEQGPEPLRKESKGA